MQTTKRAGIYLDSNASTPLSPRVLETLQIHFKNDLGAGVFANASSIHSEGRKAKRLIAEARDAIAQSLQTDSEQLIFTASGTEANQLAIRSVLEKALLEQKAPRWITTPVEHDSVLQMRNWFEAQGGKITLLPVNERGEPNWAALDSSEFVGASRVVLLSCMWVNNETGVITDLSKAAAWCLKRGVFFHIDACQAWGKLPIAVETLGAHFVSFSAHKIGGFAGTGVLWVGRRKTYPALFATPLAIQGTVLGKQEKGRRGGSENLIGILAAGAAAQEIDPETWTREIGPLRERFEAELLKRFSDGRFPQVKITAMSAQRVANTTNFYFPNLTTDSLVMALDLAGYCVSAGSACASGVLEPSHVLLALGLTPAQAQSAIRVSLSKATTWEELEGFLAALEAIVPRTVGAAGTARASQVSQEQSVV